MTSFTAKGEVFIKTATTEILHLPTEDNRVSHNFEATRPEKNSIKSSPANAFTQPSGDAEDDANTNCQFPTIVVHSVQETPTKSQFTSSSKVGSKEARKHSPVQTVAPGNLNTPFDKVSLDEIIEPFAGSHEQSLSLQKENIYEEVELKNTSPYVYEVDFTNTSHRNSVKQEQEHETRTSSKDAYKGNELFVTTTTLADSIRCSPGDSDDDHDGKIIHGPRLMNNKTDTIRSTENQSIGFENEVYLSKTGSEGICSPPKRSPRSALGTEIPSIPREGSATSLVKEAPMGQKRFVSQPINDAEKIKESEKRKMTVPLTVSRLITSSASMFEESMDQREGGKHQPKSTELSFKFGSNLSLRASGKY